MEFRKARLTPQGNITRPRESFRVRHRRHVVMSAKSASRAMAMPLHQCAGDKEPVMLNRVVHSAAGRLVCGLIGVGVFVQSSQYVSVAGVLAMALGGVLIITAGADVAPRSAGISGNA
jgi:hypothetical protein